MHFILALAAVVLAGSAVLAMPTEQSIALRGESDKCSAKEDLHCCDQVSDASDPNVTKVLSNLGISADEIKVPVGLGCPSSPATPAVPYFVHPSVRALSFVP
jgi:hypothetical protein